MRSSSPLLPLVAAWLLAGCAAQPPRTQPYAAREVVELARWQVIDGGKPVAYLRHLEIRDSSGPIAFYRVEDLQGRWLGHANALGRFSRRVPFREEEEDLGVWSMAQGAGKLVDATATVELRAVAVEASARRAR